MPSVSRPYNAAVGIRRHGCTGVLLRHRGPRASSGRTARRLRPTAIHALECRGRIYNTSHLHSRSGQPVPTALCASAAPRTGHLGTWRADALVQWQWHTIRKASSQIAVACLLGALLCFCFAWCPAWCLALLLLGALLCFAVLLLLLIVLVVAVAVVVVVVVVVVTPEPLTPRRKRSSSRSGSRSSQQSKQARR